MSVGTDFWTKQRKSGIQEGKSAAARVVLHLPKNEKSYNVHSLC